MARHSDPAFFSNLLFPYPQRSTGNCVLFAFYSLTLAHWRHASKEGVMRGTRALRVEMDGQSVD